MTTLSAPIRRLGHAVRGLAVLSLAVPHAVAVAVPVARMRRRPPRPRPPDAEDGGVREPRRPKPQPPVGAIALSEPADESRESPR
jgi:hypothetical protein